MKTKLWYLENEMITEQGYISSKDIRRAPGEVWKVAFPKVKINIREQTSPPASFPQKVKVLKTETIFFQIRNAISFWIRVLNLCYWRLYWNSLIRNLDSRWRFCTEKKLDWDTLDFTVTENIRMHPSKTGKHWCKITWSWGPFSNRMPPALFSPPPFWKAPAALHSMESFSEKSILHFLTSYT